MMVFSKTISVLLFWIHIALVTCAVAAESSCTFRKGFDRYGGDIQPLGKGFRNATSVEDCCHQCDITASCHFFSYAPVKVYSSSVSFPYQFPPHNCWLKESAGQLQSNRARTSGTSQPVVPTPSPSPTSPFPDACFGDGCPLGKGACKWCDFENFTFTQRVSFLVDALRDEEKIQQISTFTPETVPG